MQGMLFNIQRFSLHDGPGIRTVVFFKGCGLKCQWCANPESQSLLPEGEGADRMGRLWTVGEAVREAVKDRAFYGKEGGVTLSGGDPLMQPDFACALSDALRAEGIGVGLETSAFAPEGALLRVLGRVCFAYIDLKHHDGGKHLRGTGAPLAPILGNLRIALRSDVPVTVRIPVVPGFNDAPEDAEAFSRLLRMLGARDVHLLPFHQMGESKYEKLGRPYAYAAVRQLHEEDLAGYASGFDPSFFRVQVGG